MPQAPLKYCSVPCCSEKVTEGRCEKHRAPTRYGWETQHQENVQRIRGRKLQRLREQLFREEPLCRQCVEEGRVRLASIRDHIIPIGEGGTEAPENIAPICEQCHAIKIQQESARGVARSR